MGSCLSANSKNDRPIAPIQTSIPEKKQEYLKPIPFKKEDIELANMDKGLGENIYFNSVRNLNDNNTARHESEL